jgi:hypothetical protein
MQENDRSLDFTGLDTKGATSISATIEARVIAGWTGCDPAAMEAHIVELEKLGIAPPKTTPIFYRGAAALLTTGSVIEVVGTDSSGEVEPVVFSLADGLWLGVCSDHIDRKVEAIGVTISKQLCAKPVGGTLWRYADVQGHWDDLVIRSFAIKDGKRRLYQEGPLSKMRHPSDLTGRYPLSRRRPLCRHRDVLRHACRARGDRRRRQLRTGNRGPFPQPQDCAPLCGALACHRGIRRDACP